MIPSSSITESLKENDCDDDNDEHEDAATSAPSAVAGDAVLFE